MLVNRVLSQLNEQTKSTRREKMVTLHYMRKFFSTVRPCLMRGFCMLILSTVFVFSASESGQAQTSGTLTIENINQNYAISPYSYVTTDDEQLLNPDTLISRHRNNLKGKRLKSDVIHFKATPHSTWVVFSIYNKTPQDNWVLDFGGALNGRMGLVKKINIMNYGTKQTLIFPDEGDTQTSPFLGSAIPVRIAPGTESTFVLYIEADPGLPLVIAPTLKSQDSFMAELVNGDVSVVLSMGVFICIIGFFLASYFIGRNKASIALFSYYLILCALFFNLNANLVASFPINGSSILLIYVASFTMLLICTKFFAKIDHDFKPIENMVLVVLFIMIGVLTSLGNFVFGHSPLGVITICGSLFLCSFLTCIIAFFSSDKSVIVKGLFCGGILLSGISALVLTLPLLSILPATSLSTHIFWSCFILQSILFIASYLYANTERIARNKQDLIKQEHEGQSLLRLQKSKDSADHARLLRVIERERELMAELREREVKRTEEMRGAKEIADSANKAKSAFLAVVSHEIRTPMNGILGMVQLMQQTELSTKQKEYINTIKNSGDTMMALLNDILDFEKIERGGMELETVNFDLHRLANDVVTLMSGHSAQKNIILATDIDSDVPQYVSGDPTRLRQVLLNLVNNGLKFTSQGHVTIKISINEDQSLYFAIEDSGIGISQDAQDKLFTPFTQANASTTRKYGGTGLGLAISNRLIEAMGGKIDVKSQEGVGSTFFFSIIMQSQSGSDTDDDMNQTAKKSDTDVIPMNILVVEDNEMNRQVLDGLLTNQGHSVMMAANGMEAIETCKKNADTIDIILMDIQMDGMNGVDATKLLRADSNPSIARKPIIALTGNVILEEIQSYFEIGINGFIAKPINADTLYEVLDNAAHGSFESPLPQISENDMKNISEVDPTSIMNTNLEISTKHASEIEVAAITDANPDTTPEPQDQVTKEISMPIEGVKPQMKVNLELDDREYFIDSSQIKSMDDKQDPFTTQNIGLSFEDSEQNKTEPSKKTEHSMHLQAQKSPKASKEYKEVYNSEEMTEIQKYLMSQHSEPSRSSGKEHKAPVTEEAISQSVNTQNTEKTLEDKVEQTTAQKPEEAPMEVPRIEERQAPGNNITSADQSQSVIAAQKSTPSPEPEISAPKNESVSVDDYLDDDMLKSLLSSLGEAQFYNLLEGFVNKTEEIIEQSVDAAKVQDLSALSARAHELKGMAGNFGLKYVSALSGDIEKMAKTGQKDNAFETTKKLNAAYEKTQAALKQWRESQ